MASHDADFQNSRVIPLVPAQLARLFDLNRALLDADAMAKWLPANGFTGKVHHLDAKVGGTYKILNMKTRIKVMSIISLRQVAPPGI